MKKLLILGLLLFVVYNIHAQEFSDSIKIERDFWGYYQNDFPLKLSDLIEITANNNEAYQHIRMARSYYYTSAVFGIIGTGFVGYPSVNYYLNKKFNIVPCVLGGLFIGMAITHSVGYHINLKRGVDAYNKGLTAPKTSQLNLKIGQTSNGFGIALRF